MCYAKDFANRIQDGPNLNSKGHIITKTTKKKLRRRLAWNFSALINYVVRSTNFGFAHPNLKDRSCLSKVRIKEMTLHKSVAIGAIAYSLNYLGASKLA